LRKTHLLLGLSDLCFGFFCWWDELLDEEEELEDEEEAWSEESGPPDKWKTSMAAFATVSSQMDRSEELLGSCLNMSCRSSHDIRRRH